ncbi:hypothetical protein GCM10027047_01840 [Rhodococcus aerolatus]
MAKDEDPTVEYDRSTGRMKVNKPGWYEVNFATPDRPPMFGSGPIPPGLWSFEIADEPVALPACPHCGKRLDEPIEP